MGMHGGSKRQEYKRRNRKPNEQELRGNLSRRAAIVVGTSRLRSQRFFRNSQRRVSKFLTENDCGEEATT